MDARAAVTWFSAARAAVGLLVIGAAYSGAVGLTDPARAGSTPAAATPALLEVDARALATPATAEDVRGPSRGGHLGLLSQDAWSGEVPGAVGGATPPQRSTATATPTPREVFLQALARSSWPLSQHGQVEARVGTCENTVYDPTLTRLEENGSTSTGLLMVNSVHADLAARFDLTDPLQNLNAGKIVADRHRAAGLPSPWMNCDALIAARAAGGR